MIDWNRVNTLREEVGADDFEEVVDIFLEEVEEVVERLGDAPDPATVPEDLHFLKGSAMSLGFTAFADQCQAGEVHAAKVAPETVDIDAILGCYAASKQVFLNDLPTSLAG